MKKKIKSLLLLIVLVSGVLQGVRATTVEELRQLFVHPIVTWNVTLATGEKVPLTCKEQYNSFSVLGYQTYNAYHNGQHVGAITISAKGNVMGTLSLLNRHYNITSANNCIEVLPQKEERVNCTLNKKHSTTRSVAPLPTRSALNKPITDGYFRDYRLAVLFSTTDLHTERFGGDIDKVKTYLANLETFLNNIYVRDLGIHFTLVHDDRLIKTNLAYNNIGVEIGTWLIDNIIGNDNYDVGVAFGYDERSPSRTTLGAVQAKTWKGNVTVTDQEMWTVAHELGHFFGGNHTFSTGAERDPGQSILGYGHYYRFIAKSSMDEMYYTIRNGDRIQEALKRDFKHKAQNHAPKINRSKMQEEYIVPKETFFTIPIYATDEDGDSLWYGKQQEGYQPYNKSIFPNYEPTRNNVISFGRTYNDGNKYETPHSGSIPVGEYQVSLYVNDMGDIQEAIKQRKAPLYDEMRVKVKVVEAEPFKFSNQFEKTYKTGEKLKLTWKVDKQFFKQTDKVRILLSEDGGKTFPHLLMPETANNGECEVILPQKEIKQVSFFNGLYHMGLAVFRLETADGRFFDLSNNDPKNGGIEIKPSGIVFEHAPTERVLTLAKNQSLPDVPNVTAKTKEGVSVTVQYKETKGADGWITRMWEAKNGKHTAYLVQYIRQSTTTTAIELPTHKVNQYDNHIYNLEGKRIDAPIGKGIYIKNGKKFVVR